MRSLHCFTELLEFFEWDEERCAKAIDDFADCVNSVDLKNKQDMNYLKNEITHQMTQFDWSEEEINFLIDYLKKQSKDEITYEEKYVINK